MNPSHKPSANRFLFRAWQSKHKRMLRVSILNMDVQQVICMDENHKKYVWDLSNCVLMQFTGLTDKNGKEIFEGDIIESYAFIDTFSWVDGGYTFDRDTKDAVMTVHYPYEVIGNVYENPTLLS